MADEIDMANDRAARDLELALRAQAARTAPGLQPCGQCYNCGDEIAAGLLWCDYVAPGETRPACANDYSRRNGGQR